MAKNLTQTKWKKKYRKTGSELRDLYKKREEET